MENHPYWAHEQVILPAPFDGTIGLIVAVRVSNDGRKGEE